MKKMLDLRTIRGFIMALQTLEGDLIPMRPAKETLTRYAVLLLGAAILSLSLIHS